MLGYTLNLVSPVQYFNTLPCPLTDEKRSYICLYLELVCLNEHIKNEYSWETVMQALGALLRPFSEVRECGLPESVEGCLKKLMV
jgi:hypothetical protein